MSQQQHEINILLLGETGVGKSTTLNALANYFKYPSFEEAKANLGNFFEVSYTKFSMVDPVTGNSKIIESGPKDRQMNMGESITRIATPYTIGFGDYVLRLIDTPGIGDVAGTEQDKLNFEEIFTLLSQYQRLHAVIFIIKGNETRKHTFFKYCITELLANLHKDISKNIYFCFTFSRNSMYGPGEGFATLKSLIEDELKEQVKIQLKVGENCFFIDNEAYRFFVATKHNFPFQSEQGDMFKQSWNASIPQIKGLFECIITKAPYDLISTISLTSVRKSIIELAQPMLRVQNNINENIASIEKQKQKLANKNESVQELKSKLHFEVEELKIRELPYKSTVCTDKKCIEVIGDQIHYKTRCHTNCGCIFVQPNTLNQRMLCLCECMSMYVDGFTFYCHRCGCKWSMHMHILCEFYKVRRSVLDPQVLNSIQTKEDAIQVIESSITSMQKLVNEYRDELKSIQDISSKFAYILSTNAQFSNARFFEQYLDFLIDEERKKPVPNVDSLLNLKNIHSEQVRNLKHSIDTHQREPVPLEQVPQLRDQLLNLPHHGETFRDILNVGRDAEARQTHSVDKPIFNVDFSTIIKNVSPIVELVAKILLKK